MQKSIFTILAVALLGVLVVGSIGSSFAQEVKTVNVVENKLVTLVGEGYDPDNEALTFLWEQIEGDPVQLSSYTIAEPTFMAPIVPNGMTKSFTFKFTVTDPQGATSSDTVKVVVNAVNNPPMVDLGKDKVIYPTINAITITSSASDPDNDPITYNWEQLSGQQIPMPFTHGKYLNVLASDIDFSQFEPLEFKLTVSDGFGGVASDTVLVYPVTGFLNNPLISVDAGPMQIVKEGQTVTLHGTGQTSNGQPIDYTWYQLVGPKVVLNSYKGADVEFTAPDLKGKDSLLLSFQLTGYSPGNGYAADLTMVKVIPFNAPPVADAGPDMTVSKGAIVKLVGSGTDPENDPIRFSWTQVSGNKLNFFESTANLLTIQLPPVQTGSPDYVFELKVTDSHGNFDTDTATVSVNMVNGPPKAYAGPDQRITSGGKVTVEGSGWDPDGDDLTFTWKQVAGETVSTTGTAPKLAFTAPTVVPGETKRMVFELTVMDTANHSNTDQVIIYVVPENNGPSVNVGPDMTVNENTSVNLTCTASDPDNDPLTFQWTSSNPTVVINSPSSAMTTIQVPKVVKDQSFTMTCTASDGKLTGSDSLIVNVKNILTDSIVADAGQDRIVDEEIKVTLDGSKSYDPEGQALSYKWTQISGEPVTLTGDSTVKPSFTSPVVANGEVKVLVFELKVFDQNGRSATDTVEITVDPVNAPPEATASAKQ